MEASATPIFIFSLPRSGSTLAQRILASHPSIRAVAEPWLLLPVVYALRSDGAYAEYEHATGARAIREFIAELPAGMSDYQAAVREMALRLYRLAAGAGARYFLDKTPRYHLIVREILEIFPDAKCLLLWRNPLAVAASMINTWGKRGRWNVYRYNVDLYKGVENLDAAAQAHPDRFLRIRYEDMVARPSEAWPEVFSYLGLAFDPRVLRDFSGVRFSGSMGDAAGARKYEGISADSVAGWTQTYASPLRKLWARRYLDWIGPGRLAAMGYDRAELMAALSGRSRLDLRDMIWDAALMSVGAVHAPLDLSGLKRQLRRASSGRRCYSAT